MHILSQTIKCMSSQFCGNDTIATCIPEGRPLSHVRWVYEYIVSILTCVCIYELDYIMLVTNGAI